MATLFDFWNKKTTISSNTNEEASQLSLSSTSESLTFNLEDHVDENKIIDENEDTELNDSISRINMIDNDPSLKPTVAFNNARPCQPDIKFPSSFQYGTNRKFNKKYYSEYPWVEYSQLTDCIYCFSCRHFKHFKDNKNDGFINGIQDWKNLNRNLKKHQNSEHHITSYAQWMNRMTTTKSVVAQLSSKHDKEVHMNRKNLATIIRAIYYLSKQGLAFRGHIENQENSNNGNLLELLEFISETDPDIKRHLDNSSCSYTSPKSQNEIISCIAKQVKNRIIDSVGEFYSIIVDETMDIAKLEQISFCIRYCDNNLKVHEKVLGFFETATTDSQSLHNLI